MKRISIILLFVGCQWCFISCKREENNLKEKQEVLYITNDMAETMSKLPLKCIQKEFPNKLNQTLSGITELGNPKELHPAFYGCYDWHSSVHGHWMLIKLLTRFPELSNSAEIKAKLKEDLTSENIKKETEYFNRINEKTFERTYGWAWLLKLDEELLAWNDTIAKEMHVNLAPLTELLSQRYMEFLPKLNYPVRSGEHPNTAFGLTLAYDWALAAGEDSLVNLIKSCSRKYFLNDRLCPINWEPGGYDFLSPCLQEADLMSRILPAREFKSWLDEFLPALSHTSFKMDVAKVSDRTDGKLVHLDGVNFCRAWSLYKIARVIPEYNHLVNVANDHIKASLPNIVDEGYEGEHWLASFAIYALRNE